MAYRNADEWQYAGSALNTYLDELDELIQRLSSSERAGLMRNIGKELQGRNSRRILDNVDPQNVAYIPRTGRAWDLRRLREGETIRRHQKFNFFKERDIELAFTRETYSKNGNPMVLGRRAEDKQPFWQASGFVREGIYVKDRRGKGKLRMFKKLGKQKWLRFRATSQEAAIGFMNGVVARVAAEHHYGMKGLPQRELIGLPKEDMEYIRNTVWEYLVNRK